MAKTTYRLIPQVDGLVSVEMTKSTGRRQIIPDFRNEAEANAWVIQARRLIEAAGPQPLGATKRA
jgi:hypothetical protein